MKSKTKVALGLVGGVVVGGAVGYFVASSRIGRKALQAAEEVVDDTGLRLPDPSFAMELPYTDDQFAVLDEVICECGEPIVATASSGATLDDVGREIQDCIVREIYPQFPWPAISGDHPSVSQLYHEVGALARRALANGEICSEQPLSPESNQ